MITAEQQIQLFKSHDGEVQLDVIISVGYRVKSQRGVEFEQALSLLSQTLSNQALVKLEKMKIISSSGEHKSKVYHKPNITVPTPDNVTGKLLESFVFFSNPDAANDEELKQEQKQELKPELQNESIVDDKDRVLWKKLEELAKPVKKGSKRTTPKNTVKQTIIKLCKHGYINLANLALLLDREPNALRRNYLNPLVSENKLSLAFPTTKNHPQLAYIATKSGANK